MSKKIPLTCLILFFITLFFVPLLLNRENKFLCYGIELNPKIIFSLWLILLVTEIIALLKSQPVKILIVATFFLIFFQFLFLSMPSIGKPLDAKRVADLEQIRVAQLVFCSENQRYAVSQRELVENGYLSVILNDPRTGKEYTDADGIGLEGGDNDPMTFAVQTTLEGNHRHEICSKKKIGNIFLCTQEGCKEY